MKTATFEINDIAEFPNKLRELRGSKDITQKQLAEKANVSQQTISAIEKGRMEPSLKILFLIATALGICLLIGSAVSTNRSASLIQEHQ